MEPAVPDYLFTFISAANALLLICPIVVIWAGVLRLPPRSGARFTTAAVLSFLLLGWFAAALILGQRNVYWAVNNIAFPTIQFGIVLPIVTALVLMMRSQSVARLIDALPLSWLVGVQFYRALGFMFLVLWHQGFLPWEFALPAGIGDVATGVLALVVAGMLVRKVKHAHAAAYAWCLFGIADLVVAVSMGALTSPGLTHFLSLDAPNMLVTAFPLVMIPTFGVPLSIILHGLCLWKLRRMRRQASSGAPA